jgi:peptidoglycan/LPS O-acetylase OafA/YrhL
MQLIRIGWVSIQMFFVLSGFLITGVLMREKEKQIPLKEKFRNFWARRILRIFPLYYLYVIFLTIFLALNGAWSMYGDRLPWLYSYTFNYYGMVHRQLPYYMTSHLWSMSVEEQFYLAFPFIVLLTTRRQLKLIAVLLIISAIVFRWLAANQMIAAGLEEKRIGGILYVSTLSHLDAFLLGGSLVLFDLKKWSLKWLNLAFTVLLTAAVLAGYLMYRHITPGPFDFNDYITHIGYSQEYVQWYHHLWGYTTLDTLFAMVLLLVTFYNTAGWGRFFQKILSVDILVFFGKISYGMYIIHMALKHVVNPATHYIGINNKYIVFCIYLPVVVLPAWLIYNQFELRFLKLKKYYT